MAAPPSSFLAGQPVMRIEEAFVIAGRGLVVTGAVQGSTVRVGDSVVVENSQGTRTASVSAIEALGRTLTAAEPGTFCGLLLKGVAPAQVGAGDTVSMPR